MAEIFDFDGVVRAAAQGLKKNSLIPAYVDFTWVHNSISDATYDEPTQNLTPKSIASSTYINDSDGQNSQRFSDSKTTQAQQSFTVRQGVNTALGSNVQVTLIKGVAATFTSSRTVSFEKTEAQVNTETQVWAWDTPIQVPPRCRIDVELLVDEIEISCSFTSISKFSGDFIIRTLQRAYIGMGSQRVDIPTEDIIGVGDFFAKFPHPRVTVIDSKTATVELSGIYEVRQGRKYRIEVKQSSLNGNESNVTKELLSATRIELGKAFQAGLALTDATIGVPRGTHYRIISTRSETRMTPACGFNDLGVPNGGTFNIENRLYEEYDDDGNLIRSWMEEVEIFDHCISV